MPPSMSLLGVETASLGHVSVTVADLSAAETFYGEALGLARLPRPDFGFPGAWYSLGETLSLHVIVDPTRGRDPEADSFRPDFPHFAITVEDADRVADLLRERGLTVHELRNSPTGLRQIFVKDADGNMVEFIGPAGASSRA